MGAGRAPLAFGLFLGCLLIVRIVAIYTESVNWDEFALLARASETARTGELAGGGRPGLATLLLIPVVDGCRSAVDAMQQARWLWSLLTITAMGGFWILLRQVTGGGARARRAAMFGLALLVLVPVFLRWSVQVRTDQGALAFGLWGAVALLASRRRTGWALLAGLLFGVGFLFSQKLIYVAALGGLLAVGVMAIERDFAPRRDLLRVIGCLGGGGAVLFAFDALVTRLWTAPTVIPGGALGAFSFYRETLGYSVYAAMLPTLIPHVVLAVLSVWLVVTRRSRAIENRQRFTLALSALALGGAVLLFHAGAFPYFWMTLGLFPAVAGALALAAFDEALPSGWNRVFVQGSWVLLVSAALLGSASMLRDSQSVQRVSLGFIEENFAPEAAGFHPESALFCRAEPDIFETFFTQTIRSRFEGPDGGGYTADFLETFRTKPVSFIVDSWRLPQFPEAVQEMILGSYTPYRHAVRVPGITVTPEAGQSRPFEVIVPGRYRWWPASPGLDAGELLVGGIRIESGEVIELAVGSYPLALGEGTAGGILALDLETPPDQASIEPFYGGGALAEFFGWPWWRGRQ